MFNPTPQPDPAATHEEGRGGESREEDEGERKREGGRRGEGRGEGREDTRLLHTNGTKK